MKRRIFYAFFFTYLFLNSSIVLKYILLKTRYHYENEACSVYYRHAYMRFFVWISWDWKLKKLSFQKK